MALNTHTRVTRLLGEALAQWLEIEHLAKVANYKVVMRPAGASC